MSISALQHIRKAVQNLNPNAVRELTRRPVDIVLYAATLEDYRRLDQFFLEDLAPARRREAFDSLHRAVDDGTATRFDLAIYDESVPAPRRALVFEHRHPERLVKQILETYDDLAIPLARLFPPFRRAYVDSVIRETCRENAIFSLASALPDIIPSVFELPWAVTEFASDTAVLTVNQIKMAFLIAAASDREVGYLEQKSQVASIIGSAFGWRAIARELIGKVPFGGGLLPKAAIAYAGTKLVGLSLDRFYRIGYMYTREERKEIYSKAFEQGKHVAAGILQALRPDLLRRAEPHLTSVAGHRGSRST